MHYPLADRVLSRLSTLVALGAVTPSCSSQLQAVSDTQPSSATELEPALLDTNDGRRTVDAIISVISSSTANCDTPDVPKTQPTQEFLIARIDAEPHLTFIKKSMKRWPSLANFDCVPKGPRRVTLSCTC